MLEFSPMNSAAIILTVDDDPHHVRLTEIQLERLGVLNQLRVVANGTQAVDYLAGQGGYADRAKHPFPGLVFLDLSLPEIDGFEVLKLIRGQLTLKELPVVMISASNDPGNRRKALRLGANGYYAKTPYRHKFRAMLEEINEKVLAGNAKAMIQFAGPEDKVTAKSGR
jgi:two-component system, response regulator